MTQLAADHAMAQVKKFEMRMNASSKNIWAVTNTLLNWKKKRKMVSKAIQISEVYLSDYSQMIGLQNLRVSDLRYKVDTPKSQDLKSHRRGPASKLDNKQEKKYLCILESFSSKTLNQ